LPGYGSFGESAFGAGKKHAAWHLQTLGVHPDHQRRGAARQLVDAIAKKAASDKSMMVVECTKEINVGYLVF
jgi:ribosomal protein S18 acetylase RimI-like enzyme